MSTVLELTKQLIRCPSVTPNDAGCQTIIAERLKKLNFHVESMRFGEVDNLWARMGTQAPLIVFAGHTDVVPPGPLDAWSSNPFDPLEREAFLYGRGAADMKSGVAAMVVAVEEFLKQHKKFSGSIGFLITSDEEGPSINGTKKVMEALLKRQEKIDYCIIGEASSNKHVGDQLRVGRRGSMGVKIMIHGKQGHIAFPHLANNPIHSVAGALKELTSEIWDKGNESFPPTSFQISNIHAGTGALNVIPGVLEIDANFRFSTAVTADELQQRVKHILEKHNLNFNLQWDISAQPFLTARGKLIAATQAVIKEVTGQDTELSTGGGTSDGRFIAPTGAEVVELGPCNGSVHQVNEHVRIADLDVLVQLYQKIVEKLLI